jgi:hypothetical protein
VARLLGIASRANICNRDRIAGFRKRHAGQKLFDPLAILSFFRQADQLQPLVGAALEKLVDAGARKLVCTEFTVDPIVVGGKNRLNGG